MTDVEKVRWLQALLTLWGVMYMPMIGAASGAFIGKVVAQEFAASLLLVWVLLTVGYLLILSWRVAYLSGRNNR